MKGNDKMQLLKPKNDVVFHCLFRKGNESITKALISSIIEEEIDEIELDNDRYLLQTYPDQKMGILDLKAKLNDGIICNIEIQLADKGYTEKRLLDYWSNLYSMQLKIGEKYHKLQKAIIILIADYDFGRLKEINKVHTKWQIREEEYFEKVLTEDLEIHIISLPKARKKDDKSNTLLQWLAFLDNPNREGVMEMKKKNQDIADALWKLEEISEDEKLRKIAEVRERWERDELSAQDYWKENGLAEGRKQGLEEGRAQGLEQGREEGIKEAQLEIAKEMLKNEVEVEMIIKCTGIAKEKLEELKRKFK